MAAAAAVHERFLQLAADNVAHHVGIGFPLRVEFGQVQPQQAVHAVQIGLGADEFQNGLRGGLFSVQQQRFVVNHLIQIDIGKGFGIARQHVQAGLRIAQRIVSVVQPLADHAQICVVLLFDGGIGGDGILEAALFYGNVAGNHIGARAFGVGLQSSLHFLLRRVIVATEKFRLRHFAIKLCNFKLIGLLVVR